MKEKIQATVESFLPELWAMSREMYDHPELGMQEFNSSRLLREWLTKQGFAVEENFHGMPTAFRAVYGSGKPVIAFLCEYDALPEVGHGCGHDLIGVMSAGAAAALKETVDAHGGTIVVYGTPDEEVEGGKVQLTNEGAFDETDVALMAHPSQFTCARMSTLGIYPIQFEFFGKKCHAAQADHTTVNALDAAVLAYLGISQQKRYLEGNIHGILKDGGTLPNIIPDYACLQYYVRCAYEWQTKAAVERLTRCAQGAADSVGATLKTTNYLAPFKPLLLNEHLYLAMEENLRALGVEFSQEFTVMGSTDMGDVSFKIPAIHLMLGIKGCEQMDAHTKEFAAATVSENGRNATRSGVCALAFTAYDLLTNPKLLAAVKADFQKALQEQHKKGV